MALKTIRGLHFSPRGTEVDFDFGLGVMEEAHGLRESIDLRSLFLCAVFGVVSDSFVELVWLGVEGESLLGSEES
jgi:hypothetical protein